jgi:hypothetical protein
MLACQPDGRGSLALIKQHLAVFYTSGPEWTARMKSLAERAPQLDIFAPIQRLHGKPFSVHLLPDEKPIQGVLPNRAQALAVAAEAPVELSAARASGTVARYSGGDGTKAMGI